MERAAHNLCFLGLPLVAIRLFRFQDYPHLCESYIRQPKSEWLGESWKEDPHGLLPLIMSARSDSSLACASVLERKCSSCSILTCCAI